MAKRIRRWKTAGVRLRPTVVGGTHVERKYRQASSHAAIVAAYANVRSSRLSSGYMLQQREALNVWARVSMASSLGGGKRCTHLKLAVRMNHATTSGWSRMSRVAGTVTSKIDFSCTCVDAFTQVNAPNAHPRPLLATVPRHCFHKVTLTWKENRKKVSEMLNSAYTKRSGGRG